MNLENRPSIPCATPKMNNGRDDGGGKENVGQSKGRVPVGVS
jgi:hypothetical protein